MSRVDILNIFLHIFTPKHLIDKCLLLGKTPKTGKFQRFFFVPEEIRKFSWKIINSENFFKIPFFNNFVFIL